MKLTMMIKENIANANKRIYPSGTLLQLVEQLNTRGIRVYTQPPKTAPWEPPEQSMRNIIGICMGAEIHEGRIIADIKLIDEGWNDVVSECKEHLELDSICNAVVEDNKVQLPITIDGLLIRGVSCVSNVGAAENKD